MPFCKADNCSKNFSLDGRKRIETISLFFLARFNMAASVNEIQALLKANFERLDAL